MTLPPLVVLGGALLILVLLCAYIGATTRADVLEQTNALLAGIIGAFTRVAQSMEAEEAEKGRAG